MYRCWYDINGVIDLYGNMYVLIEKTYYYDILYVDVHHQVVNA